MQKIDFPNLRVLLVDGSDYSSTLVRSILSSIGVRHIAGAKDVLGGLEHIKRDDVDIVLTEYKLPDFNGVDFLKAIRTNQYCPKPDVSVVMVTAHGTRSIVEHAAQNGVDAFILKPVRPVDLIRRLKFILQEDRPNFREWQSPLNLSDQIEI